MKKVVFSQHALERMEERAISKKVIIDALLAPDKIERSFKVSSRFLVKKIYFNKKFQRDHLLLIIYEEKDKRLEIITVIDTSKISKYF